MRKTILSIFSIASLFAASQANAANVTVILDLSVPGTFDVRLSDSLGDNTGIASYGIPVTGVLDSLDHNSVNSPFAQDAAFVGGSAGFSFLRSADGVALLGASQDTITPTPHLINGFGQTASDFASEGLNPVGGAPDGTAWDAELLIGSGTYSGAEPGIDMDPQGGIFVNVFLPGGSIEAAEQLDLVIRRIPEPGTIALAGLGLIGIFASRRRK